MAPRKPVIKSIEGLAKQIDDQPDVQLVAESDLAKTAADEEFMHEPVQIMIMATTDPNASPIAHIGVNGVNVRIARNVPTWIKRMHLEVLARMKETRVTQDLTPNREGEITMDSLRGNTGLAYPFTVLQDKNPKGGAWLANVLAERG